MLIEFSNAAVRYPHFMELVCFLTPDGIHPLLHTKTAVSFLEQRPILVDDAANKIR